MALSQEILIKIKKLTDKGIKYQDIAQKLGIGQTAAHRWQRRFQSGADVPVKEKKVKEPKAPKALSIKELDSDEDVAAAIEEDRALAAIKTRSKNTDKKYNYLLKELELADERLNVAYAIKDKINPISIPTPRKAPRGNATAIALASDWHVGEVVDPATVSYLNEYNPAIAEKRSANYFKNLLKLIETQRHSVEIDTVCLWIGGDIITGYIHEELVETNSMSPIEECLFAQDLLSGGIKFLLKEGGFKKILVPCSYGNHGRTTPKKRVASGYKNSYEWGMYNNLARYFEGESRVQFQISNGYFNYVEVYNRVLRFHHGDNIGYQGGVGGVTIPLNKFIARSNQQRVADLDLIGHFHQLQQSTQFTINGSLIGFGAYAQSLGASPESAQQAFKLLDSKRGFTVSAPIQVVDDSERYGHRRAA
jgi:transposase